MITILISLVSLCSWSFSCSSCGILSVGLNQLLGQDSSSQSRFEIIERGGTSNIKWICIAETSGWSFFGCIGQYRRMFVKIESCGANLSQQVMTIIRTMIPLCSSSNQSQLPPIYAANCLQGYVSDWCSTKSTKEFWC